MRDPFSGGDVHVLLTFIALGCLMFLMFLFVTIGIAALAFGGM